MPTSRQIGEPQTGNMYRTTGLFSILLFILVTSSFAGLHLRSDPALTSEPAYPWYYQRDGQALAPSENPVVLVAVGDLMLGRGMASRPRVFAQVAPELRSADLTLGNFEGAIPLAEANPADQPADPAYEAYRLLIPASAAEELQSAGFDLVSLANNHSLDAGEAGLANTQAALEAAGVTPLGAEFDQAGTRLFTLRQIKGLNIAFLAFNRVSLPSLPTGNLSPAIHAHQAVEAISELIRLARAQAEVIIVSLHWGVEYQLQANPAQKEMARALLQAGADLVLGHHPHVAQEIEISQAGEEDDPGRAQLVAYSLGNFAFDQGWDETRQGLALRIYLDKQGLRAVQALPVWTAPRPHWMSLEEAGALLERVSPPPPRLGFACPGGDCQPVSAPQAKTSGIFWSGQIDLTGDGVPEKIRRVEQSIVIYQDGQPVWESPPEWRVVDLALGDPNDDGRNELVLALYKPAPSGGETSHPFILGYRSGMYRLLWGGSAVRDPILEVELGDVTGDGRQELVVLEESAANEPHTLAVWRWHGWGFSQLWRSPNGHYRDLSLIPGEGEGIQTISISSLRDGSQTE
ncbi:MAG TPA: CapA family protein [Anaerolineales bacterium]|nr:CapA family protein [Anaerolineales bacterium]